jgi:RimJ/RimL family protein N-acetyltransferase
MTMELPVVTSERLRIRPLELSDMTAVHGVLSRAWNEAEPDSRERKANRERWLGWSIQNYGALASLMQPPYGDRAVCLIEGGELIGCAGLVPSFGPFGQLDGFPANRGSSYYYPEIGLFWAIDPEFQGRGYATEAGRALVDAAFRHMNAGRIVATTEFDNAASIAVMKKLAMTILRNELPSPPWFQVVGVLERD